MEYKINDVALLFPEAKDMTKRTGILPMVLYKLFGPRPVQLTIDCCSDLSVVVGSYKNENLILFYPISEDKLDEKAALIERIAYAQNKGIEKYISANLGIETRCMINVEQKKTVIMYENTYRLERSNFIYEILPALIPWEYPDNKTNVTDDETKSIQDIVIQMDRYNDTGILDSSIGTPIGNLLHDDDLVRQITDKKIELFGSQITTREIKNAEKNMERMQETVNSYLEELKSLRRKLTDTRNNLIALRYGGDTQTTAINDMLKFISASDRIVVEDICESDSYIGIRVKTYLSSWNEDTIETLISNKRSYMYNHWIAQDYEKETEKFWTELFVNETIRLPMQAMYTIYVVDKSVSVYQGNVFRDSKYEYICPNPHLYFYECLGTVEESFEQAFNDGDLARIPMLCTVSAGSLHTEEEPVMEKFVSNLFEEDYMIEYDGDQYHVDDFVKNIFDFFPED